jgi:PKD repeat protein
MVRVSSVRHGMWRAIFAAMLAASISGCGLEKQSAPSLTGPSELGLSLTVTAQPDQLSRDGSSRSQIVVSARDAQGRPAAGQLLTVSSNVGTVTQQQVVTGSDGRATFDFIAPPFDTPVPGNVAIVGVIPVGNNFDNATPRTVAIALTGANTTVPNPSFTFTPTSPRTDQVVSFDASETTDEGAPCGTNCNYAWDFGDGNTGSGRLVDHQFRSIGTFVVTLTVTDLAGSSANTRQTVRVVSSVPPTPRISYSPQPPAPGEAVRFSAAESTGANGATIVEYLWDFGNGQTASGVSVTTSYPGGVERTYVVQLTIRDSNGATATISQPVSVEFP